MSSFFVGGKFITDKKKIREMWAGHFEELGTPSENIQYDSDFLTRVTANVQEIFTSCTDDRSGVLSGPLQYEKVARVCSQLKLGVCGVLTLFGPGFFHCLKAQGVFSDPLKISRTIQGGPMKLCTVIALLKVYRNT